MNTIRVKALPNFPGDAPSLFWQKDGNVGIDLYAAETFTVRPGENAIIPTGLAFGLPVGTEAEVRPRSGLSRDWLLTVVNSPGTVDPSYRGEVSVNAMNLSPVVHPSHFVALLDFMLDENFDGLSQLRDEFLLQLKARTLTIQKGERFAQIVFDNYLADIEFEWVESLDETWRGSQGWGASGTLP